MPDREERIRVRLTERQYALYLLLRESYEGRVSKALLGYTKAELAAKLGISTSSVRTLLIDLRARLREEGITISTVQPMRAGPGHYHIQINDTSDATITIPKSGDTVKREISCDYQQDKATITVKSLNVMTLEDALTVAHVDLDKWEVARWRPNFWETTVMVDGQPQTITNCQVRVELQRKAFDPYQVANTIIEQMKQYAPHYPIFIAPRAKRSRRIMLEISIPDLHLGKKSWSNETGENYDIHIAETLYMDAITDLLEKSANYEPELILVPLGNDFFHVDTWYGETTKGTRQDADDRAQKIFGIGLKLMVRAVDKLIEQAPVEVLIIPGNHELLSIFHLGTALKAWYHQCSRVFVDDAPTLRKYKEYGTNLIGFVHGAKDDVPIPKLPLLMAEEQKKAWARTDMREWHIAHIHKRQQKVFNAYDVYQGVGVRNIPSLTAADLWHYRKGYVGVKRAAEAYVWDYDEGLVGVFSTYVNTSSEQNAN